MPREEKLERSQLAGEFTEDDVTVLVDIFKKEGTDGDWTMEVITPDEDLTQWEDTFATDQEAFDEFLATVAEDGIRSFFEDNEPVAN